MVGTAVPAPTVAYVMPGTPDGPDITAGRLENIYTGRKVKAADLIPRAVPSRTSRNPCLVAACTGSLWDGTCTPARG